MPIMTTLSAGSGALTTGQVTTLFACLAAMLVVARILGEVATQLRQPTVLGEILAGLLLGPTLLGQVAPEWHNFLFPQDTTITAVLEGLTTVAIALFLLVAGMEVDLGRIWRQGRIAMAVSAAGMVVPFALGFAGAMLLPYTFGMEPGSDRLTFALFMATALSISALPVIAKILMDLNLYRTDLGMTLIAAAIVNDLGGWMVFAVVLGMMRASPDLSVAAAATQSASEASGRSLDIGQIALLTLGYTLAMLTVGRFLFHRALPYVQAYLSWPGGVIGLSLALALGGAAFTQWIGIHGIFGSFIIGIVIGSSSHLREQTRNTIHQFISFFFAPIFFASIGVRLDFVALFDPVLVAVVLAIACVGKVVGCGYAARWCGMERREAWALGWGMNARGAMEIILGKLALDAHLISPRLFVALVVMALVTSLLSGPLIQRLLRPARGQRFVGYLCSRAFVSPLLATDREGAIRQLAHNLSPAAGVEVSVIAAAGIERERMMATGLPFGAAVPHARIEGLKQPLIGVGLSPQGIDFEAADGKPAHVVFLILTPKEDQGAQLRLLADISRVFQGPAAAHQLLTAKSHTQLLAILKSLGAGSPEPE